MLRMIIKRIQVLTLLTQKIYQAFFQKNPKIYFYIFEKFCLKKAIFISQRMQKN